MRKRHTASNPRSAGPNMRTLTAVRTALIGYGALALGFILPAHAGEGARMLVWWGIGIQIALILARHALSVQARSSNLGEETRAHLESVIELVGDGVTVLLFALATLGGWLRMPAGL